MYHPAGLSFLSKAVGENIRGKAIGLHESIGNVGSGLAFISLGLLGGWRGWRPALMIIAVPGLLLSFLYLLLGENMSEEDKSEKVENSKDDTPRRGIESILGIRKERLFPFYLQMGSNVVALIGFGGFTTFLASFLHEVYGLPVGLGGSIIGVSYLTGFFGNITGGRLSDKLGPVLACALFSALTALSMIMVAAIQLPFHLLFLSLLLCFIFFALSNPANKALLAEHSHIEGRSSGYGSYFMFSTAGLLTSGPLFGFLIEEVGMRSAFLFVPLLLGIATTMRFGLMGYDI